MNYYVYLIFIVRKCNLRGIVWNYSKDIICIFFGKYYWVLIVYNIFLYFRDICLGNLVGFIIVFFR